MNAAVEPANVLDCFGDCLTGNYVGFNEIEIKVELGKGIFVFSVFFIQENSLSLSLARSLARSLSSL